VKISELDPAQRRARGPFRCIGCGEELLARLGQVRARHFAHRPGSTCPLTSPETALHLDAKVRLLELSQAAFSGALEVELATRCPVCRRQEARDLAALGDAAILEGAAGSLRADLLVTRGGRPSFVIEVRVTHQLDEDKQGVLAALGLPAVEIDARQPWEEERSGVILLACARSLGFAPCPSCALADRAAQGRAAGGEEVILAELEAYRARGLLGPRPGPLLAQPPTLSDEDRQGLRTQFSCRECGGQALELGDRVARHTCPGRPARAVAWRGYDGTLVLLNWWRRA
jgi:hypothetical protein